MIRVRVRTTDDAIVLGLQVVLLLLAVRCVVVQVGPGSDFRREVAEAMTVSERRHARRGEIRTADGWTLAYDELRYRIGVDPVAVGKRCKIDKGTPDADADRLRRAYAMEVVRQFVETFGPAPDETGESAPVIWKDCVAATGRQHELGKKYQRVATLSLEDKLRFDRWRGIIDGGHGFVAHEEYVRRYPLDLAKQIVGPSGSPHEFWGIESHEYENLRARHGVNRRPATKLGGEAVHGVRESIAAIEGLDVTLTIDAGIQRMVETETVETCERWGATSACAIVLDPDSGALLAAASSPTFEDFPDGDWDKKSVKDLCRPLWGQNLIAPGSTVKPLVVARLLEDGVPLDWEVKHEGEEKKVLLRHPDGWTRLATDVSGSSPFDVRKALVKSSNVGLGRIGFRLGPAKLQEILDRFEFGASTGYELPEQRGTVPHRDFYGWQKWDVYNVAIGYRIQASALQIARAHCAIANGGLLPSVHIVEGYGDYLPEGRPEPKRVLEPAIARELREIMRDVVADGAERDELLRDLGSERIRLCGKTGTAEKRAEDGTYDEERHCVAFVGFAPLENPRYLMMMIVDDPEGSPYASECARPPVCRTLTRLLAPERPVPPIPVPERLRGDRAEQAGRSPSRPDSSVEGDSESSRTGE